MTPDKQLMTAIEAKYGEFIADAVKGTPFPAALVAALVANETGLNESATRFESEPFYEISFVLIGRKAEGTPIPTPAAPAVAPGVNGAPPGSGRPQDLFDRPTDIAWDAQGNIFVADGYFDARVVKYDKTGRFVKAVGTRGAANLQFNTPHSIATDFQGNVYVADRGNARVQVLDNNLNWKANYPNVGNPWAICVSPGPHQYLFVSNSVPDNGDSRVAAQTGEIYKMELDGTILGKFGKAGKMLKEFSTVHEIDCRNPSELLVSEITAWRVQKIILHPPAVTARGK